MRTFIAIEFEASVKEYIYEKQQEVKKFALKGNFSNKNNFHLTLHFIGEADEEKIKKIKEVIDETVQGLEPFTLALGNLGHFPRKNKHILWFGIENDRKPLFELVDRLRLALKKQGLDVEDQPYRPHITIGREVILNKEFTELQKNIIMKPMTIDAAHISLMESVRVDGKLVYRPIYKKALK